MQLSMMFHTVVGPESFVEPIRENCDYRRTYGMTCHGPLPPTSIILGQGPCPMGLLVALIVHATLTF